MALDIFNGADPSPILDATYRDCSPEQVLSVQFRSESLSAHSVAEDAQWRRIRGILDCRPIYEALSWKPLPIDVPATFYHATGLETIGTLANLLLRGGIHCKFVDSYDDALQLSCAYLDEALIRCYDHVEAYSCREAWCEWFDREDILNETVLLGNGNEWWLLAFTGTD